MKLCTAPLYSLKSVAEVMGTNSPFFQACPHCPAKAVSHHLDRHSSKGCFLSGAVGNMSCQADWPIVVPGGACMPGQRRRANRNQQARISRSGASESLQSRAIRRHLWIAQAEREREYNRYCTYRNWSICPRLISKRGQCPTNRLCTLKMKCDIWLTILIR